MGKPTKEYEVIVYYPDTEEGKLALRKKMGEAYSIMVENYIMELPISSSEKTAMYNRVMKKLIEKYGEYS